MWKISWSMNAFQQGVCFALGYPVNVGTPDFLFHPANFKDRLPIDYVRRKLSTQHIAALMHVDPSTVHVWRQKGWLKGRRGAKRMPNGLKFYYWRHSLKDIEDCLLTMKTRKRQRNPVEYKAWTPQEKLIVLRGERPEGRSRIACRVMRHRLRKLNECHVFSDHDYDA